jgi:hypothetical protein
VGSEVRPQWWQQDYFLAFLAWNVTTDVSWFFFFFFVECCEKPMAGFGLSQISFSPKLVILLFTSSSLLGSFKKKKKKGEKNPSDVCHLKYGDESK